MLFATTLLAIVNPIGSAVMLTAEVVPEAQWKALAVVPLAIPGTVGAGTIVWLAFFMVGLIARRLGPIGMNIVTRVMGILVVATAFGLLARGMGGLLPGLLG